MLSHILLSCLEQARRELQVLRVLAPSAFIVMSRGWVRFRSRMEWDRRFGFKVWEGQMQMEMTVPVDLSQILMLPDGFIGGLFEFGAGPVLLIVRDDEAIAKRHSTAFIAFAP